MKKKVFGRQLKRDSNERKALFKGLMSSLVLHGRIQTTQEKAKSIKGQIEKLVTRARKGNGVFNSLQKYLTTPSIKKLIEEVAPHFQNRPGGYTRIIRLGERFSDNASMVVLEWVEEVKEAAKVEKVEKVAKVVASNAIEKVKRVRKTAVKKEKK